jgi:hypothetical protein
MEELIKLFKDLSHFDKVILLIAFLIILSFCTYLTYLIYKLLHEFTLKVLLETFSTLISIEIRSIEGWINLLITLSLLLISLKLFGVEVLSFIDKKDYPLLIKLSVLALTIYASFKSLKMIFEGRKDSDLINSSDISHFIHQFRLCE